MERRDTNSQNNTMSVTRKKRTTKELSIKLALRRANKMKLNKELRRQVDKAMMMKLKSAKKLLPSAESASHRIPDTTPELVQPTTQKGSVVHRDPRLKARQEAGRQMVVSENADPFETSERPSDEGVESGKAKKPIAFRKPIKKSDFVLQASRPSPKEKEEARNKFLSEEFEKLAVLMEEDEKVSNQSIEENASSSKDVKDVKDVEVIESIKPNKLNKLIRAPKKIRIVEIAENAKRPPKTSEMPYPGDRKDIFIRDPSVHLHSPNDTAAVGDPYRFRPGFQGVGKEHLRRHPPVDLDDLVKRKTPKRFLPMSLPQMLEKIYPGELPKHPKMNVVHDFLDAKGRTRVTNFTTWRVMTILAAWFIGIESLFGGKFLWELAHSKDKAKNNALNMAIPVEHRTRDHEVDQEIDLNSMPRMSSVDQPGMNKREMYPRFPEDHAWGDKMKLVERVDSDDPTNTGMALCLPVKHVEMLLVLEAFFGYDSGIVDAEAPQGFDYYPLVGVMHLLEALESIYPGVIDSLDPEVQEEARKTMMDELFINAPNMGVLGRAVTSHRRLPVGYCLFTQEFAYVRYCIEATLGYEDYAKDVREKEVWTYEVALAFFLKEFKRKNPERTKLRAEDQAKLKRHRGNRIKGFEGDEREIDLSKPHKWLPDESKEGESHVKK